jgi:hypothetical protein
MIEGYDVAQVCPNGHVANSSTRNAPEDNKDHCEHCGEKTITACPQCQNPIRGLYWGEMSLGNYRPPAYSSKCGQAFPWTQARIEAAVDFLLEATGEPADRVKETVQNVVRDTPKTQVAAGRIRGWLSRAGPEGAKVFRDILVEVISETAKKVIWPGP